MDIVIWVHDIFSLPLLYGAEQANLSYFPITGYILSPLITSVILL